MSAQANRKQASRWGSLLQGAVANLESRLDTILAEEGASKRATETTRPVTPDPPRSASPAVGRDAKDLWSRSRNRDPSHGIADTRASQDTESTVNTFKNADNVEPSQRVSSELVPTPDSILDVNIHKSQVEESLEDSNVGGLQDDSSRALEPIQPLSSDTISPNVNCTVPDTQSGMQEGGQSHANGTNVEENLSVAEYQVQIAQMRADYEAVELQRQDDIHAYLERIDALQSKLQYLASEAVEAARASASEAPNDSLEKRLAAKNEQIAMLMEEGQKLSKMEVTQSTTVRKLRAKAAEDGRSIAEVKRKLANAERAMLDATEKVVRLESSLKDASAKASRLLRVERELDEFRRSQSVKDEMIEALRRQIDSSNSRAELEQKQAVAQALEVEKKIAQSLREDNVNLRIEMQLSEERNRGQSRTISEDMQREKERSAAIEAGLRTEILALEGRLEVFRARTEEVSSGITNDSQAKLMRQVETLQNQYVQASENWQGIESALQTKLSAMEVQKDEAARQETETRRKLREAVHNSRILQEQLDETARRCNVMEHELAERQATADKLQSRVNDFEKRLREAKEGFEREKQAWEMRLGARVEEEKLKWRQDLSHGFQSPTSQIESPTLSYRKAPALDLPMQPLRRGLSRNASVELSFSPLERSASASLSRRSSAKPGKLSDPQTPNGLDSGRSTPFTLPAIPDIVAVGPSVHTIDQDDPFETGSSGEQTINDVVSGSTAGPGPSVQLVERMSATVRRLESEKAALKDELTRLSAQRDEARKEIVSLMKEVDAKRIVDAKASELEAQVATLNDRYQTTLEMLGEKSERVDELEADVDDLKKIYKDLVMSLK